MSERITISWDELNTRKVEQRIGAMRAVNRNLEYAQLTDAAPEANSVSRGSIWYNTLFYMSFFGLMGGLLAWTCGTLLHFRPAARLEAADLMAQVKEIHQAERIGKFTPDEVKSALDLIAHAGRNNAYFTISNDPSLSESQKAAKLAQIGNRDQWKEFIGDVLSYGVSGLIIAMFLSMADAIVSRNIPSMVINGSV